VPSALDRHALDRIARAVVTGRRGLGRRADRLADATAALMRNRLEAASAPGLERARRLAARARPLATESPTIRRLLERAAEHLASLTPDRVPSGRAHPR